MRYRARANGNVLDDVPASLVGVLYDPIEEEGASEPTAPEPDAPPAGDRGTALTTPEAPLLNAAHTETPAPRSRKRRRR